MQWGGIKDRLYGFSLFRVFASRSAGKVCRVGCYGVVTAGGGFGSFPG